MVSPKTNDNWVSFFLTSPLICTFHVMIGILTRVSPQSSVFPVTLGRECSPGYWTSPGLRRSPSGSGKHMGGGIRSVLGGQIRREDGLESVYLFVQNENPLVLQPEVSLLRQGLSQEVGCPGGRPPRSPGRRPTVFHDLGDTSLEHQPAPVCRGATKGEPWGSMAPTWPTHPAQPCSYPGPPPSGLGVQHPLPGPQPAHGVSPPWPGGPQRTPSSLTARTPPRAALSYLQGAQVPWGRHPQAHPACPALRQLGPDSAGRAFVRPPSSWQAPAEHLPPAATHICVAVSRPSMSRLYLPVTCGPQLTTGSPEKCSASGPNRYPVAKTDHQWAGAGRQPGPTMRCSPCT